MRQTGALTVGVALLGCMLSDAAAQTRPFSGVSPKGPINTLKEFGEAFYGCFRFPPPGESRSGMQITVVFAVNRSGEILGEPRFTFSTPDVPAELRASYQRAVADAFGRCVPFPLTGSLGNAIAGRPIPFHFNDTRGQRKA